MPPKTPSAELGDPLAAAVEIVRAFANRRNIPWIPGIIGQAEKQGPVIHFELPDKDGIEKSPTALAAEAQAFVEALDRTDTAMIVASVDYLTMADWEDSIKRYQAKLDDLSPRIRNPDDEEAVMSVDERDEMIATLKDRLRQTKAAKQHVGMISQFDIFAITRNPTLIVNWWDATDWRDGVLEAERAIEQVEEAVAHTGRPNTDDDEDTPAQRFAQREFDTLMEQRRLWNGPKRKEVIRQLAEHPDFPKCKTEADKVYVLDKLLENPADVSETLKKELARSATAHYKFEVAGKTS